MGKNPKILITGAGGFVGMALFNKLRSFNPIGVTYKPIENYYNMVEMDLRDASSVKELFDKIKPKIVFHFAALTNPELNEKNKFLAEESNIGITENIVSNIKDNVQLIYHSTDKVFDGTHPYPSGDTVPKPNTYHGELKAKCESIITAHVERYHILRLSVIHSNVDIPLISTNRGPGSFIDHALKEIKKGNKVTAFNNVYRCFTKREELISFHKLLIGARNYGTYNIGTGITSYFDRITNLCEEHHIDTSDKLLPITGNINPIKQNMDTSKVRDIFAFKFT